LTTRATGDTALIQEVLGWSPCWSESR
jgi:hypothetical protein